MLKFILVLVSTSTSVFAAPPTSDQDQDCMYIAQVAASIMKKRQGNILLADQLAVATQIKDSEKKSFYEEMVEEAYSKKQLLTDPAKAQAVQAFARTYYDECMQDSP